MFKPIHIISIVFIALLACTEKSNKTDETELTEKVKAYLFLNDSATVQTEITDTMHAEELNELIAQIEKNMFLIDQDLDTLSLMIDDRSYKMLAYQKQVDETTLLRKSKYKDSLATTEVDLLKLKLRQAQLTAKRTDFKQTNRVLMHLRRSVWANIAGFEVDVKYTKNNEPVMLQLLVDANFNVID